jgi:SAM-dependent methyltransferase
MSNPKPDSIVDTTHGLQAPSDWVQRWAHLVKPGAAVLDVACGAGRHTRYFTDRGCKVTAIDRDENALKFIAAGVTVHWADIENGPWPCPGEAFDTVVVTNYLWRALLPTIVASLAPGGVLIYETFSAGNESVGKPSRPDFLLQNGELLRACEGLRVVAFEDGFLSAPDRFVQRIAAVREPAHQSAGQSASIPPARYPL